MTTPILTSSISCYSESFKNLEFGTLLKKNEAVETLEQVLADTRKELGAQQALVHWLEMVFKKQKQNYYDTLRSLEEKIRQKRLVDRNLADLKDTISDLRTQVANLNADRQTPTTPGSLSIDRASNCMHGQGCAHNFLTQL